MKDLCHFESINLPTYILLTFAQHCAALGTDRWHKGQRPRCKLLTQLSMNRNLGRYYVHTYLLFLIVSLCFRIFFFVCFTAVFNISFIYLYLPTGRTSFYSAFYVIKIIRLSILIYTLTVHVAFNSLVSSIIELS